MRHNIFQFMTEEQCKEFFRDKTDEEIRELILGFNKKVVEEIKKHPNEVWIMK